MRGISKILIGCILLVALLMFASKQGYISDKGHSKIGEIISIAKDKGEIIINTLKGE